MKKILALGLLYLQSLHANQCLEQYFSYIDRLGQPAGNYQDGEIQIALDPVEISTIQKVQEKRLLNKGFSEAQAAEFSRIGVVNEDHYWLWLRDAVYFPKGIPGTYDRLIWKCELQEGASGVAVLPVLPSGELVLNLNYRHATRSWELELPRGAAKSHETEEAAAMREVKEETGLVVSSVTFLGKMTPDTGALSAVVPVYIGKISTCEESNPDYSEAIAGIISFTKDELKQGLIQEFLEVDINGEKKQVPLRDSFLTFALYQAQLRELL